MLLDIRTNRWSPLADGDWLGYNEWSHDGKYINFRKTRPAGELVRVRVGERVSQQVLSLQA